MKITVDANVLIRSLIEDHPAQTASAKAVLDNALQVVIPLPTLCEFVWVLGRSYKKKPFDIGVALRNLLNSRKIDVDTAAVAAGLAMLDAGGDFADGVIAFDGRRLGGEVFVTFDRQAAQLVKAAGGNVELLATG